MKTRIKNLLLVPLLIAGLGLMLAGRVTAQTFTTLYSFTATSGPASSNSDGANPYAGLILSGSTLYGTAEYGGSSGVGTVFKVNTNGTGFTNLHSFDSGIGGANPVAGLILSGNTLYGTALQSGNFARGTVFKVNTDGTGFTHLHSFTPFGFDGAYPYAGLILSGNTLYGTARAGGSSGFGTVFKVNTDDTSFTTLHGFTYTSDGAYPYAGLILSGNTLYGTASAGGSSGGGTVFKVNTDGTGFTNLHSFNGGSDGSIPQAALILSGNTLYGTVGNGSISGGGTVFKVNTDGTGFTNLHSFNGGSDGGSPFAGLILSGNTLYGTTRIGGSSIYGTVFKINTNGTGFTRLHSFTGGSGGANPYAGLILSGNTLYGTTFGGGGFGNGTVFSLSLPVPVPPQLTIVRSGANVVLTWPTNFAGFDYTGFTLQSTTNFVSPVIWITNFPAPVVVNGQNTVTNPASETQTFYRLSQ